MRGLALAACAAAAGVAGAAAAEQPDVNYLLHCRGCHLPDGSGKPGAVPDFRGQIGAFLRTPEGRAYLVQVPGSATAPIDDAELATLLNWIVARFDPESARSHPPVTQAEVSAARGHPLDRVEDLRARLLGGS